MSSSRIATLALAALLFSAPALAESRCSFAHYPVAPGDVNEYRTTSRQFDAEGNVTATTSSLYREEITAVEADRYRVTTTADGNVSESEWLCGGEGLAMTMAEYPGMTITATGVSIPARMEVGDEWTQVFESRAEGFSQKMTTVNRVTAREEITVSAGTWEALRVDYEIETSIPDQPSSTISGTQWFAPGVGLVRTTSTIPMEGEVVSVETTIELLKRTTRQAGE